MTPKNTTKTHRTGVQTTYTEDALCRHLWVKKLSGMSLRKIAEEFGEAVSHADIQRALGGIFPKDYAKRDAFGLLDDGSRLVYLHRPGNDQTVGIRNKRYTVLEIQEHPKAPPVVVVQPLDKGGE